MAHETIHTLVVGAGQAGVAMSEHLSAQGIEHLVFERHRIAERWRSERWDTLVANGPAWHDRFPSLEFVGVHPDAFPNKETVADYFVNYARHIKAPIRCGVTVTKVTRSREGAGFLVETDQGTLIAQHIVAATGPFQVPLMPNVVPNDLGVHQIHSNVYRNPDALPKGGVLVVGAGSSGAQIADEILAAGRQVYLSIGAHDRPPRSYRGRDFVWWLGVLNKWDAATPGPGTEHVTIAVSGAQGGKTVDFRRFAARGMTLLGMTQTYCDGTLAFAPDLRRNIERGDANYLSVLDEADAYIVRNALDLAPEPQARALGNDPACLTNPILSLDLKAVGITTIIWATGYGFDYNWLPMDLYDEKGRPKHQRGVSAEAGIYFLGLPWQSRRGSAFIWGVWHDAKYLADHIARQQTYLNYHALSLQSPQP